MAARRRGGGGGGDMLSGHLLQRPTQKSVFSSFGRPADRILEAASQVTASSSWPIRSMLIISARSSANPCRKKKIFIQILLHV
jgi:hypothetical protein